MTSPLRPCRFEEFDQSYVTVSGLVSMEGERNTTTVSTITRIDRHRDQQLFEEWESARLFKNKSGYDHCAMYHMTM